MRTLETNNISNQWLITGFNRFHNSFIDLFCVSPVCVVCPDVPHNEDVNNRKIDVPQHFDILVLCSLLSVPFDFSCHVEHEVNKITHAAEIYTPASLTTTSSDANAQPHRWSFERIKKKYEKMWRNIHVRSSKEKWEEEKISLLLNKDQKLICSAGV